MEHQADMLQREVSKLNRSTEQQSKSVKETVESIDNITKNIRGMLKRWFIEPHPNVFVSTLNQRTHEQTVEYIKRNTIGMGLLIISSYPNCQGYKIETTGSTSRKGIEIDGLWIIAEKWKEND